MLNSKTKILIVTNSAWNLYNFRRDLMAKLQSENHKIIAVSPVDKYLEKLDQSHFSKHIPLKQLNPRSKNIFGNFLFLIELFQIYKAEQPDLILHYTIKPNIFGNLVARFLNIPTISTVTGLGYTFLKKGIINSLTKILYRVALKNANQVVFHNSDDLKLFRNRNIVYDVNSSVVKGSGVDCNYFRPLSPTKKQERFRFLFLARLLLDKGICEYVEASKIVRQSDENVEFLVAGEANAKNPSAVDAKKLSAWTEQKTINYLGEVRDIQVLLRNIDVLVLPSYREGMPRAILEAMAMGKPIITTDVAGCRDTVKNGENGFLVEVKNSKALAAAMIKIRTLSKDELKKMGRQSRKIAVVEFDTSIVIAAYLKFINEISSNK